MPAAFRLPHLAGLLLALALGPPLSAPAPAPASAQAAPEFDETPFAPGQWNIGRRLDESEFRYCVDPRDPDWEVDGAIADAIAQGLLLEPKRYVVQTDIVLEDITKVYALMLEHCDVHMGFKLIPQGYPEWITLSRPYYETGYVFVSANPDIHRLADLPPGRPIGATIGTSAHIRLISYLNSLPVDARWPIYPFGTNDLALDELNKGTVDVALVWGPSFWGKQQSDPAYADLRVVDSAPLPQTTFGVGALMLSNQAFLRTAVDQAIAALTADGTIAGILEKYGLPATAAP